jgi:uncharacterized protein (TIGR00369 family)
MDDGSVRGGMTTGPWMTGPGGRPSPGCLGVLADDVLGYALVAQRPRERWSVSIEISIDVLGPVPTDGSRILTVTEMVHTDTLGGLASGRMMDESGQVIAVCRQRGRYVTQLPPSEVEAAVGGEGESQRPDPQAEPHTDPHADLDVSPAPAATDVASLLGVRWTGERPAAAVLEVTNRLTNPLGNLHGGVSLCGSELVAIEALRPSGPPLVTASVRIAYLRPSPVGTTVTFTPAVQHRGRTLGLVQVVGTNLAGKVCTIATITAQPPEQ